MSTIQVDVVSAEELIFEGLAEFVALPGESGELGIYPRHTPLITRIRPGSVRVKLEGQERLAEQAMVNRAGSLDYARAQAELAEAVAQLAAIQRLRKIR